MAWSDVFKVIFSMLASVGAASLIIFGLSNWLGKVWANRILEKEKSRYQKDIEKYKSELEELKTNSLRYSGRQFELYNQLWKVLCDLEDIADVLWDRTGQNNLEQFISNLLNAKKEVKRSRLFLEDEHYNGLLDLFTKFENYKIGKERLVSLRNPSSKLLTNQELKLIILENSINRNDYKNIINQVGENFKRQLRGDK